MKFSCTQENLTSGLGLVSHVAARSTSLPILSNILLRFSRTGVELTATNLEVAVVTLVRGKGDDDGVVTVQGKLLAEAVSLLPNERVDLELEATNLTLICGKHHTVVRGVAADDFPVIPEVKGGESVSLPAAELAEAINQVALAVNPDEGRPEISGLYLGSSGKKLVLVGTDSYRLAERSLTDKVLPRSGGLIIPLRAAQEVGRVVDGSDAEAQVEVVLGDNQVLWRLGETQVVSRLIAGQYPDYQQIIPREFVTQVVLARSELVQAVRAASLFVRSGINDVRLSFEPTGKLVRVSSTNSQLGENSTELEAKSLTGQPCEIVFNYRYLLDGLQTISSSEVSLELVNATSPAMLKPVGKDSYRYLIMPIRQ